MDTQAAHDLSEQESGPHRRLIPLIVSIAFLVESIDSTVITTSIPRIAQSLGCAPLSLHLTITIYTLSLAIFIPLSGWIADRFGSRRVFACALATFLLGSIACGLSGNIAELVMARALQGLGGAMTTPVGRLILLRYFSRRDLAAAMSFMVTPVLIGPLLGPFIGGAITTYFSWRWIFFVNVPVIAVGISFALRFVPPDAGITTRRLDLRGFLLVMLGLGCLQMTIENVIHTVLPPVPEFLTAATGVLALVVYVRVSRHVEMPALDLSLFKSRTFRIGVIGGSLCRIGVNAQPFLLPLLFQVVFGMSAIESGSISFGSAIGALITRPLMVPLLKRLGFRRVMCLVPLASSCFVAGCTLFGPHTPHALLVVYLVSSGMASSILFNSQNMLVYSDVPRSLLSSSVSVAAVAQQLSMSFGISLAVLVLSRVGQADGLSQLDFNEAFLVMAALPLSSLALFWRLRPADGADVSGYDQRRITRKDLTDGNV